MIDSFAIRPIKSKSRIHGDCWIINVRGLKYKTVVSRVSFFVIFMEGMNGPDLSKKEKL